MPHANLCHRWSAIQQMHLDDEDGDYYDADKIHLYLARAVSQVEAQTEHYLAINVVQKHRLFFNQTKLLADIYIHRGKPYQVDLFRMLEIKNSSQDYQESYVDYK
ncbi:hypothetical protein GQX74_002582 [Glossina fuscipes]|nr:hypothetical protein GQX74_002582 [Glossina fuscipes]